MKLNIITDDSQFLSLKDQWNKLLEESPANCVYLSWEWLYTWWRIFNEGRELFILMVYKDDHLIGIAPFIIRNTKYFKFIPCRKIEFLGTGENRKDEVGSNYMDFIILKNEEEGVLHFVLNFLLENKVVRWDEIYLSSISRNSDNMKILLKLTGSFLGLNTKLLNETPCLFIRLPSQWEEYLNSLGSNTRRDLRRDRRVLEEDGKLTYEVFDQTDADQHFDAFIDIHKMRWKDKKTEDAFESKKFLAFQKEVISLAVRNCWVKISFLKHNGNVIAGSYHFCYNRVIYGYQIGSKIAHDKRLSIGKLEYGFNIEDAINKGFLEYDFYKSNLKGYKSVLAKESRYVIDLRLAKRTLKEIILNILWQTKFFLKGFIKKTGK